MAIPWRDHATHTIRDQRAGIVQDVDRASYIHDVLKVLRVADDTRRPIIATLAICLRLARERSTAQRIVLNRARLARNSSSWRKATLEIREVCEPGTFVARKTKCRHFFVCSFGDGLTQ